MGWTLGSGLKTQWLIKSEESRGKTTCKPSKQKAARRNHACRSCPSLHLNLHKNGLNVKVHLSQLTVRGLGDPPCGR